MKKERKIIINGKDERYIFQYTENGKKKRRYFKNIFDYRKAKRDYHLLKESKITKFFDVMDDERLEDMIQTLKIIPKSVKIYDCVRLALKYSPKEVSIDEAMQFFIDTKDGKISEKQHSLIKSRLKKSINYICDFENATADNILKFIKDSDIAPKTAKHYLSLLREFFNYCQTKKYFLRNPFEEIHNSELPKVERKSLFITPVKNMKAFFKACEKKHPELVGFLALVAFGGLRTSEAQKVKLSDINFRDKSILISFRNSKTGQTWLQVNMPANVWKWLEKYPPCEEWESTRYTDTIKALKDSLEIGENAFRHAFATYHLSLCREAPKTSLLMRHTNANQLWQTYLEGLTSEKIAKAYFAIVPTKRALNLPITSEPLGSL